MKLTAKDIKLLGRNTQVRNKILEKFGSVEEFAKAADMSVNSVRQYFTLKKEYYGKFKEKLEKHLGPYDSIVKSDARQVEAFVDRLAWDIHLYTEDSDREVLDMALKLSEDHGLDSCIAMSLRNLGMYHLNRGKHSDCMTFFTRGRDCAQKAQDCNAETLIVSEIVTAYTFLGKYKDANTLIREFEKTGRLEKADAHKKFWYYYIVANLYFYQKDYFCAKNILEKARDIAENNYRLFHCLNLMGVCNKREGDYSSALVFYKQALSFAEANIDKAGCYNNIADVYHVMNYRELAIENIDRAVELISPENMMNQIGIYETYADIKTSRESTNRILKLIEDMSENIAIPFVLAILSKVISRDIDIERVRQIIVKYIDLNSEKDEICDELYKILGKLNYKEVKQK